MNVHRLAVVGVAVVVTALTTAACGPITSATNVAASAATPSPTLSPKDVLIASTKAFATTSYRFTMKTDGYDGYAGRGASDPASKAASVSISATADQISLKEDFVLIGTDLYMKVDTDAMSKLGIPPDKYMHLDATKLSAKSLPMVTADGADPLGITRELTGVDDATTTDGRTFTGTLDLTKAAGSDPLSTRPLTNGWGNAKAVPFAATVDAQGRLTNMKIGGFEMTFFDFNSAVSITKPPASQVVAPPDAFTHAFGK